MLLMVRLDTNPLQMPADADDISDRSETVCVCSSHPHWWASIVTAAIMSLFRYYAHFVITLFLLGSHHKSYNEVAVYYTTIHLQAQFDANVAF